MNYAHLHLILNHIPVIGIPLALVFLAHGFKTENASSQKMALLMLFALAAMILPVYFTGEPAEKVVEHLPNVSESLIEAHEESAETSLVLTLIAGSCAFIALWFQNNYAKKRMINGAVMVMALLAFISLIYTANMGGKIRHSELRTNATYIQNMQSDSIPESPDKDGDDD